jgi:hypothetical protein
MELVAGSPFRLEHCDPHIWGRFTGRPFIDVVVAAVLGQDFLDLRQQVEVGERIGPSAITYRC